MKCIYKQESASATD